MKRKTSRYFHYSNRKAIIASLSGFEKFIACTDCINWARCGDKITSKCQHFDNEHYKPVKIRKTTMRKLLKRRRTEK